MSKKKLFNPNQFVATQFDTAQDKANFANHFVRFVESDFDQKLFTKKFYNRLNGTFGHIAHYNQGGFYDYFFTNTHDKIQFLRQCASYPCYGSPEHTYSDVEKVLRVWIKASNIIADYECRAIAEGDSRINQDVQDRLHPQRVAYKVAAVSENTNSFGLHQLIVVAPNGDAWALHAAYPPSEGTVLNVRLSRGVPQFSGDYEVPEHKGKAPAGVVKKLWGEHANA